MGKAAGTLINAVIGGVTGFIVGGPVGAAIGFGGALAMGFLSSVMGPKSQVAQTPDFTAQTQDRTVNVRQPITNRQVIIGEVRTGGPYLFMASTNVDNNERMHLVIALAGHEVEAIGTVFFDDEPITDAMLDAAGNVATGTYINRALIRKHLGTADQVAEPKLIGIDGWTADHRLRGIAYLYVEMIWDPDRFPHGVPTVSAMVRGMKLEDPRDAVTRWTPNAAIAMRGYLMHPIYGLGATADEIDDESFIAEANICDEMVDTAAEAFTAVAVIAAAEGRIKLSGDRLALQWGDRVTVSADGTLPGGLLAATDYYAIPRVESGTPEIALAASYDDALAATALEFTTAGSGTITVTKTGEPRFTANGMIDTARTPREVIEDLRSACGGRLVFSGGKWRLLTAAWRPPEVALDEDDLRGSIKVQTRRSRRDRFNAVKGVYISPLNNWQPHDYPAVASSHYATEDGERIFYDLDLPFTNRPGTAQRLAKIELLRSRQEIGVVLPCMLTAFEVQAGDVIGLSNDRMGWSEKAFEVAEWLFAQEDSGGAPYLGINLTVRETDASIFDWATSEEQTVDPAPNTTLPDPLSAANPTGFAVVTKTFLTETGTSIYRLHVSWIASADAFVREGGHYEVQWRPSSETAWSPSFTVDGALEQVTIPELVRFGTAYDVRIRSVNALGVRASTWQTILGYTVGGGGGGSAATEDDGSIAIAASLFIDEGSIVNTPTLVLDDGDII